MKINPKITSGIVIIVLLFIAAGFFWFFLGKNIGSDSADKQSNQQSKEKEFKVETKQLGKTEFLAGFPRTLPQEEGGTIIENSESTSSDGRTQSTKIFTTKLSAQAALTKYADFFKEFDWVSNTKGQIKSPAMFSKGQNILTIKTTKDSVKDHTVVEIVIILKTTTVAK